MIKLSKSREHCVQHITFVTETNVADTHTHTHTHTHSVTAWPMDAERNNTLTAHYKKYLITEKELHNH